MLSPSLSGDCLREAEDICLPDGTLAALCADYLGKPPLAGDLRQLRELIRIYAPAFGEDFLPELTQAFASAAAHDRRSLAYVCGVLRTKYIEQTDTAQLF